MYAYFKGTLAKKKQGSIILETGGIGYNIAYPDGMLDYLPSTGDETVIYTYTSVTQDAISLYGFPNEDALDMFKQLIKVSNVGPKAAMAILSVLNPDSVRIAIATGDTKALAKAKGVRREALVCAVGDGALDVPHVGYLPVSSRAEDRPYGSPRYATIFCC